uniref:(California timema) hypothetical protein n=1 Tax=Timema californicum TaxID=61474 RepID=A0A7R9IX38_TIMCA|nr:unnamed protein product [Timema californicum]
MTITISTKVVQYLIKVREMRILIWRNCTCINVEKGRALYIYKPRQRDPNGEQEDTGEGWGWGQGRPCLVHSFRTIVDVVGMGEPLPRRLGSTEDAKSAADSSKLAVKKPRPKASSPNRQGPQQCQADEQTKDIRNCEHNFLEFKGHETSITKKNRNIDFFDDHNNSSLLKVIIKLENHLGNTTISTPDRGLNPDRPNIDGLISFESDALYHSTTEAGSYNANRGYERSDNFSELLSELQKLTRVSGDERRSKTAIHPCYVTRDVIRVGARRALTSHNFVRGAAVVKGAIRASWQKPGMAKPIKNDVPRTNVYATGINSGPTPPFET